MVKEDLVYDQLKVIVAEVFRADVWKIKAEMVPHKHLYARPEHWVALAQKCATKFQHILWAELYSKPLEKLTVGDLAESICHSLSTRKPPG